jgi:hypothetical protein
MTFDQLYSLVEGQDKMRRVPGAGYTPADVELDRAKKRIITQSQKNLYLRFRDIFFDPTHDRFNTENGIKFRERYLSQTDQDKLERLNNRHFEGQFLTNHELFMADTGNKWEAEAAAKKDHAPGSVDKYFPKKPEVVGPDALKWEAEAEADAAFDWSMLPPPADADEIEHSKPYPKPYPKSTTFDFLKAPARALRRYWPTAGQRQKQAPQVNPELQKQLRQSGEENRQADKIMRNVDAGLKHLPK